MALLLAQGFTVDETARRAHVAPSTVTRRNREPRFRALVEQARAEIWHTAIGQASAHATQAVAALCALCDAAESESVRAQAASRILDLVSSHVAGAGFEARLLALEAAQEGPGAIHALR